MIKKIESEEVFVIKFSKDELESIGLKFGDRLHIEETDNGVILSCGEPVEIDLEDFTKQQLIDLIVGVEEESGAFSAWLENGLKKNS